MRSLHPASLQPLLNRLDRKLWYQVHFPSIFIEQCEPDVSIENSAHEKGAPVPKKRGTVFARTNLARDRLKHVLYAYQMPPT